MRSNTLMPLLQLTNWWRLNPWFVAGIDYEGLTTPGLATSKSVDDPCTCMPQHSWDSKEHWSRDDLIESLKLAEDFFVHEARYFPAPSFISNERKAIKYWGVNGFSFTNSIGKLKSLKPKFGCYLQEFGSYSLVLNSTDTLVRDDVGVIRDEFTAVVNVPAGTTADQIRVYFTAGDGGYIGDPDFNDHTYEIRPVAITIAGLVATIVAPAYLFKKPSLDEKTDCVYHVLGTYVDEVSVYLVTIDNCSHGNFICESSNCSTLPCTPTLSPICMSKRAVGGQFWGVPFPAQCNDESTLTRYCLTCLPDEVEYNYLTGLDISVGGNMESLHVDVLSKLTIGLMDCVKEWCPCDVCSNKKTNYHRESPSAINKRETDREEYDLTWQIVLSEYAMNRLDGLPPYNGILQALRFINKNNCKVVGGASL